MVVYSVLQSVRTISLSDFVSPLTIPKAFNAALTVFAGLLIKVHSGEGGDDPTQNDLKRSLDLAIVVLQNFGGGVRLAKRCGRYLEALSKVAASFSKSKSHQANSSMAAKLTCSSIH